MGNNNNDIVLNIEYVESKIGYEFNNKQLLVQAFTRKSYSEEHGKGLNNENLEFLGDQILSFYVSKYIMERYGFIKESNNHNLSDDNNFFDIEVYNTPEKLTEIKKYFVDNEMLSLRIHFLRFAKYLRVSNSDIENRAIEQTKVQADLFEAIIGAVAIDSKYNYDLIEKIVDKMLDIDLFLSGFKDVARDDFRGVVRRWYKEESGEEINYSIEKIDDTTFEAFAKLKLKKGYKLYKGVGNSKKDAILDCAKKIHYKEANKEIMLDLMHDFLKKGNLDSKLTLDNSVQLLNFMYQDGFILKPYYENINHIELKDKDGNPVWSVYCNIATSKDYYEVEGEGFAYNIKKAKKIAAYLTLCEFFVIDPLFDEYGNEIDENTYYLKD